VLVDYVVKSGMGIIYRLFIFSGNSINEKIHMDNE